MSKIGAKTQKLTDLIELGLNVPKFKAIPAGETPDLKQIHAELSCKSYAVRSSALIEDSDKESFAGQFKTLIDVAPDGLDAAVKELIEDAKTKVDPSQFSIIIQEYIEPEYSGITFTRNPQGGRECIVEYHKGRGEEIVGGKVKPEHISFYWGREPEDKKLPNLAGAISDFQKIEQKFAQPQDIEWCIKDGKWYFLQTRPITTTTDYEQSLFLDNILPKEEKFYYEKTEISEIAPRPSIPTLDLLHKIYASGGPVARVYDKYKIKYQSGDILKIVGNELFVDREAEIKTLLPSYSYLHSNNLSPTVARLSGLFTTFANVYRLKKIPLDSHASLIERLQKAFSNNNDFFDDYELIFEINLLAGIAFNQAKDYVAGIGSKTVAEIPEIKVDTSSFAGNSIEFSDNSEFKMEASGESVTPKDNLEKYAIIYSRLREMGRWLVVKHISAMRKNTEVNTTPDYGKYNKYSLPKILAYTPAVPKTDKAGLSAGIAKGTLTLLDALDSATGDIILYVKVLSPDLVEHFPKIKGIVSESGGLLSHLAIIARERHLPVITGTLGAAQPGDTVQIDGSTGEITKL